MRALILAAGLGWRLGEGYPPKSLFEFAGRSLLRRHLELLGHCGVKEVIVGVGYRHHLIEAELATLSVTPTITTVYNENFTEGNVVTLWSLRDYLQSTKPVLVMDADVLYDVRLLQRLVTSPHENCLLLDRNCDPDDEPVKVCIAGARIVELSKQPNAEIHRDFYGESVGFFKFAPPAAKRFAQIVDEFVTTGRRDRLYEDAIRQLVLDDPSIDFGFEDVSGLPWTEIDFYSDIDKARRQVLPRLIEEEITCSASTL